MYMKYELEYEDCFDDLFEIYKDYENGFIKPIIKENKKWLLEKVLLLNL